MYAQLTYFDGPRSPELIAASERAGRERITPAVLADPELVADHVATFVLRGPDGGDVVLAVTGSEASLDRANAIILGSELLPGEDTALLPGPDRVQRFEVIHAVEHGRVVVGVPS